LQLCSGAIAGLVAATPSSGFINPHAGIACGVIAAAICNYATKLKFLVGVDDSMDIFAVHGLAGAIGLIINGLFGVNYVPALDGIYYGDAAIPGGWFSHHWVQLGYQLSYICATSSYTFVVTAIILYAMEYIPGCHLRVKHDAEIDGIDEAELGEFAFDFVEVRRDFDSWNAPDPNLIEGRVREELEKQAAHEANSTSTAPSEKAFSLNGEGRAERNLENGHVGPSGRGGAEIEVEQKAKEM
jgi:ammonium transporter, Amt family